MVQVVSSSSAAAICAATEAGSQRPSTAAIDARGRAAASVASCASTVSKRSPGRKLRSTVASRPSTTARCQCRETSSAAGPLAPKCVHSRSPPIRRGGTPGDRTVSSTGWLTPDRAWWKVPSRSSGASAGVVATIECPSARAMAYPAPSLPVFGTDMPPLASTTRPPSQDAGLRADGEPLRRRLDAAGRAADGGSSTPSRAASATSASTTVAARCESGNSLPWASSCSVTPSSAKNRIVGSTGQARSTRAIARGAPPLKSRGVTRRLVMLQRPPPLMRILAPRRRAPSSSIDLTRDARACGRNRRHQPGGTRSDDHHGPHSSPDRGHPHSQYLVVCVTAFLSEIT